MNTFNSVLLLSFCISILLSCIKRSDDLTTVCHPTIPPVYLNFNVVGSSTGQDLFFSGTPAMGLKEIYFFSIKDAGRKDTIRPAIEGTGTARIFKLSLNNTTPQDTLIMKIGNRPEDKLISRFKKSQEVCPVPVVDKIFINDLELTANQGKYQIFL